MAVLTSRDIADHVAATLRDLGPLKFQQIAQNLQRYEVFSKWFKNDKVVVESGSGIQRTLMATLSNSARHVGLADTDQVNIPDVIDQIQVPWRQVEASWGLVYQTDILQNRGRAKIVDTVKLRRADALISLVEELEDKAWAAPPSSTDKKLPFGIQYWIVENATTGFNGGHPSGHSDVGGVDVTQTPNFKNYTAQYTTVNKSDLVKKMRTAHRKIRFVSPIAVEDYRGGVGEQYRIYTDEPTLQGFEDIGEGQNENLGRDIASMDGITFFRRVPIVWVPKLDERTDGPVYMIDHSTFYPYVLEGDYLRETMADRAPNQHNVFNFFVDLSYNYLTVDRRRNAVLSTAV